MRCGGSSRRWGWRPSRRRGGPPPPPDLARAIAPPTGAAVPVCSRTRRDGFRASSHRPPVALPGPSAARYTPPTAMTRRPPVMTRRLGGHQAVWRGQERAFSLPFLKWLTLSSPWRRRRPPFCHSHRGSGFARSVSLFFALVVASHARRRMNGVEGWGRHLRCGSRAATQAAQRAHPPIELREFPTPHRRADTPGGRAMRRPRCEARGQAVWVRTGCRREAARRGFRPGAAPTRRRR
jgi:hypothetical protein